MEVKKPVGMLVDVIRPSEFTNWYLSKLGSCPPTETRRQVLGLKQAVNYFGRLVIS